ncbi:peptidase inhibitor family I36 protein [Amycolatopsis albispora]|uniref:peptidase inhibitor family I36 protein n=1 Tax=Amycolatopsis albispora TaxID=1804986 RepID=UPI000DE47350|nr:peptidase inhibitor family I36 protein [Amycolatopsis albispora]
MRMIKTALCATAAFSAAALMSGVTTAADAASTPSATQQSCSSPNQEVCWEFSKGKQYNCPEGRVCLFPGLNQRDGIVSWKAGHYESDFARIPCTPDNSSCNGLPGQVPTFDNDASSWFNNTNMVYCVSRLPNGGGHPDNTMPPKMGGPFTSEWDNDASSLSYLGCP